MKVKFAFDVPTFIVNITGSLLVLWAVSTHNFVTALVGIILVALHHES